ncbi:hypothetical protein J6590_058858 [Homalodisca vitripennis]|nr:hypothetical protein J6590_058858 [Homalodisca vitripennis]
MAECRLSNEEKEMIIDCFDIYLTDKQRNRNHGTKPTTALGSSIDELNYCMYNAAGISLPNRVFGKSEEMAISELLAVITHFRCFFP